MVYYRGNIMNKRDIVVATIDFTELLSDLRKIKEGNDMSIVFENGPDEYFATEVYVKFNSKLVDLPDDTAYDIENGLLFHWKYGGEYGHTDIYEYKVTRISKDKMIETYQSLVDTIKDSVIGLDERMGNVLNIIDELTK